MPYISKNYISLLVVMPFVFAGCARDGQKSQSSCHVDNYAKELNTIKERYAYEERMLRSLEKKNIEVAEQEDVLKRELKKIIMLKGSNTLSPELICAGGLEANNASFLLYKNTLESDIKALRKNSKMVALYDQPNEHLDMLDEMQRLLTNLDKLYDVVYLDIDTVREAQLIAMDSRIKQLEYENTDLQKKLSEKKEAPVTVVINNPNAQEPIALDEKNV